MDGRNFDDFARNLAIGISRRSVLRGLVGGGGALAGMRSARTFAAEKTTICHFPPDNPANVQIISVANPSLPSHFAHGDMIYGNCCFDTDCAPAAGDCGVLLGCLADANNVSSCVYSDDSTLCDNADVCNGQEVCQGSYCAPGIPPDCSGSADECNTGACDPGSGCYSLPVAEGTSCNGGTGACNVEGNCIQICQASATCDCSVAANEGLGCNNGEGICSGGICVPTCEPNCTCSYAENTGLTCNNGEGVCTNGGQCMQICHAEGTCDCSDPDNEGLACNDGEGVCEDGICVPTCEPNCTCSYAENEGLECDNGAGVCTGGACLPACGSISGQVTDSSNGNPISGATVEVAGQTTATDDDGAYSFTCVPAGSQMVEASATGFGSGTNTVTVTPGQDVTANISLVATSVADQITIVLTWNAQPNDLDSHLTGPDIEHGGRFHVLWSNQNPVSYASLDVDDVTGSGPETVTVIETVGGVFVPGDYHYWVYNYSNGTSGIPGDFSVSGATVTIYQDSVQIAQYDVGSASGSQSEFIWYVVNFTLAANGDITLVPVQTMMGGSNGTVL